MANEQLISAVAKRFEFGRWAGTNALGRGLFVENYRVPLGATGWQLLRAWSVPESADEPSSIQTVWSNPQRGPDALLRVDVYECASRRAAHEQMLRLLGEHQSSKVGPVAQGEIGDVHSSFEGGEMAVFARGNLVIFVARAGLQPMPARAIAQVLDDDITEEPPEALVARQSAAAPMPPPRRNVMRKTFTSGGEATRKTGRMEFTEPKTARVAVYEIPVANAPSWQSLTQQEE